VITEKISSHLRASSSSFSLFELARVSVNVRSATCRQTHKPQTCPR